MKKAKFWIALAANILAGLLPLFLWRTGVWLDLFMVVYGFAGMAVLNFFFSRSWWQTALLALPLLLYPAFCYNAGMLWYYRISDDGMTKVMAELFTYLSTIAIVATQTAAVIIKGIAEQRKRKQAEQSAQTEITAEAVTK
jgi:hypothetical protein